MSPPGYDRMRGLASGGLSLQIETKSQTCPVPGTGLVLLGYSGALHVECDP